MPFIKLNTNVIISKEKELSIKKRLGNAIELLGKSENWLMISFEDKCSMYFRGESIPVAFLDISAFGKLTDSQCDAMTVEVSKIMGEELSISPDHMYIKYSSTLQWGWNSFNF